MQGCFGNLLHKFPKILWDTRVGYLKKLSGCNYVYIAILAVLYIDRPEAPELKIIL